MTAFSVASGTATPLAAAVTGEGGGGRIVQPGDRLLDESANFLTDELGNRLTG